MSTSTAPDEELIRERFEASLDEDIPTRLTRGVVDGFTEASEAFSHELAGTNRFPDLMGRSVAGVIRANARLLDELANVVRQMSDDRSARAQMVAATADVDADADGNAGIDYERLADLVAQRLQGGKDAGTPASPAEAAGRNRKS
jgi:hypothetical protein